MKRIFVLCIAVISFVTLFCTASSYAAISLFTDRAAFLSASSDLTNIDFEENAPGQIKYYPSVATFNGVSFVSVSSGLFTIDPAFYPPLYDWGSGDILSDQQQFRPLSVTLPGAGARAVGSDIMSLDPFGAHFAIDLSTGDSYIVESANRPTRAFVGFISDDPITSLTFYAIEGRNANLDNFVFGKAGGVVPEPATMLLLPLGLAGLRLIRRKR